MVRSLCDVGCSFDTHLGVGLLFNSLVFCPACCVSPVSLQGSASRFFVYRWGSR